MSILEQDKPPQLIVLGRGMLPGGEPTEQTAENAQVAVEYFHATGGIDRVVFSGGHSHLAKDGIIDGPTEADAMAHIAEAGGIPIQKIHREPRANNTLGNFVYSAELLQQGIFTGIVTHRNHMRRAMFIGSRVLGDVIPIISEDHGAQPEPHGKWLEPLLLYPKDRLFLAGINNCDLPKIQARHGLILRIDNYLYGPVKKIVRSFAQYS